VSDAPAPLAPPGGYRYGGLYRPTWANIVLAISYICRGRRRSLAADGVLAFRHVRVAPLVRGEDRIPELGPFVVVANHYERPGLWMAWPALHVSHLVQLRTGQDIRWVAIQEWEDYRFHGIPVPPRVTRAIFERAYAAYGIIGMPQPSAPAASRAAAIRSVVDVVRGGGIVGLMPEGTVGATPELLPAREGVGTFLSLLTGTGASVVPVGLFEEEGHMVASFGSPFRPDLQVGVDRTELDRRIREQVMHAIRDQLPPALWGSYRSAETSDPS